MRPVNGFGVLLAAAVAAGCGSAEVPAARVADTHAALEAAQKVGAEEEPSAALHLTFAREQIATAERLIDQGDEERAAWMLERAEADAELALALAREAQVSRQVREALDRIRALEDQMTTGGGR